MAGVRYAQFCPLARAAEVIGERWTLLIVRELFTGPQRYSDLRRRLCGVSTSVLADRLQSLEGLDLVQRRLLPPPTAAAVYELTPGGRELYPALRELARWGLRFLLPPRPDDRVEPAWVRLGLEIFARRDQTPARSFEVRILAGEPGGLDEAFSVAGGSGGTELGEIGQPADAKIAADPLTVLGLASGTLGAEAALRAAVVRLDGDAAALADFPSLFDMTIPNQGPALQPDARKPPIHQ